MKKVSQFFRNYKGITTAAIVLMFFQTFGTLYIPTLMADIVNNGILKNDFSYIYKVGSMMALTAVLTACVAITGSWLASKLSARWGKDLRNGIFHKVQSFSINDFDGFSTASMITRSTNDVTQLQDSLVMILQLVLPAPIITVGGLILAFSKDKYMAMLIVVAIASFMLVAVLISRKAIPLYQMLRLEMDEINRTLRETITGVRVIRAFNRVDRERERTDKTFSNYAETAIKVNKIFAVMMPVVLLGINLCTLAIIWFGGERVVGGYMQIGDIMVMVEYAMLIFWNLVMGIMMMMYIPRAWTSVIRINEILGTEPEIQDGSSEFTATTVEVPKLEFRGVTFQYDHAEEPVLSNLNFSCRSGETTAIIGGTGSGKSTIASLIPRFYDIQEGEILIDGTNIKTVSQRLLRNKMGFVPQKAFLFSGTIVDNLRYGNEEATEEELRRASRIAQAENFIEGTEKGYKSYVAQGGANFSGGQKQRLCIARALVKQADIYIFDDSFSALDFQTDAKLRAALKKEVKDAVKIVVAQRVSSIVDADQIIVLDDGKIADIGTHESLLDRCKIYCEIVESQMKEGK